MKITMSAVKTVADVDMDIEVFEKLIRDVTKHVSKMLVDKHTPSDDGFYEAKLKPGAEAKVKALLNMCGFKSLSGEKRFKKGKVRVELNPETVYFNIEGYAE